MSGVVGERSQLEALIPARGHEWMERVFREFRCTNSFGRCFFWFGRGLEGVYG